MTKYLLKHKNNIGAEVTFDEKKGSLMEVLSIIDESFIPLSAQNGHPDNLRLWWRSRAVPSSRSDIKELLDKENIQTTQSLLLNNLGLSMTDAISIFLDAVVMNQGMPNAAALEDAEDIRMANKAIEAEEKGRSKPVPAEIVYIRLGI